MVQISRDYEYVLQMVHYLEQLAITLLWLVVLIILTAND